MDKNFINLEQRVVNAYLDMFPPFIAQADAAVSVQSQEQFYLFIQNLYQTIFDTPEILFKKMYEDDAYPMRFNKAAYGKPVLYNHMKRDISEIDGLIGLLFRLGQSGYVQDGRLALAEGAEVKSKYRAIFPKLGLKLEGKVLSCEKYAGLFPAWKWMASRENASELSFARCMFDLRHAYMQDVYARLFGDEPAFWRLAEYLNGDGYRRVELERGAYALDYVKKITQGDVPLGNSLHGDPNHYGIAAEYKPETAVPPYLVLRILDMKNILLKFERMPDPLRDFIVRYAKECDHCGYCTQTDKSGKRKSLEIDVYRDGSKFICPLYPGFNFCFSQLDDGLVADLIAFLGFMQKNLQGQV